MLNHFYLFLVNSSCLLFIFLQGYKFLIILEQNKYQVSYNCKLLMKKQFCRAFVIVFP